MRVCVLGDGRAAVTFARALADRLACEARSRCGVLERLAAAPATGVIIGAPARPAARRLSRSLQEAGLSTKARGRLVEVTLAHGDAAAALGRADAVAVASPVVLVLPATRTSQVDELLAHHDLALVVVSADAPPALTALAVGDLERATSGAVVRAIALPARGGGAARRAALVETMESLR